MKMDSRLKKQSGSYCPGSLTEPRHRPQTSGAYRTPAYVSGSLRIPSALPLTIGPDHRHKNGKAKPKEPLPILFPSCFENFAVARKFHAENLQHQPLPDRVDDRVFFMDPRLGRAKSVDSSASSYKPHGKHQLSGSSSYHRLPKNMKSLQCGRVLGCKKPETYMDLAICWDAPIDDAYEPRRAVHIDGTDGGPAPAVFTLVQHPSSIPNNECLQDAGRKNKDACAEYATRLDHERREKDFPQDTGDLHPDGKEFYLKGDDLVTLKHTKLLTKLESQKKEQEEEEEEYQEKLRNSMCNEFSDIRIRSEEDRCLGKRLTRSAEPGTRAKHASFLRNCTACNPQMKGNESGRAGRMFAYSAGSQRGENRGRNGLPPSMMVVPRPRTPYARRPYCIDTLTPPFNIVKGCRDGDYPEHWRLTSVYQQSYKSPRIQRGRTLSRIRR